MATQAAPALLSLFQPSMKQIDRLRMSQMLRPARDKLEILIADPNEGSRQLLQDMLKNDILLNACKVYPAATAKEAWATYLSFAPDICFLGTDMPEIDGYRLARLIHTVDASAFYVMVTPKASEHDGTHAKHCSAKGLLVKPYDTKKVLNMVQLFQQEKKTKKK